MSQQIELSASGQSPGFAHFLKRAACEALHAAIWALIFAVLIDLWLHAAPPCEAPVHFAIPGAPARCLVAPAEVEI